MYTNDNTHRFPAMVLAAGFTIAVMAGLSALAHTRDAYPAPGVRQAMAQRSVSADANTPLRIDVVAYRS